VERSGNILQIVRGHTAPVSCIKMASDKLITGSWDKNLKIHEVFARKLNVESFEHSSEITVITVHPNKKQCAAATMKG
jgi:WD40 repeat protein